MKKFHGFPNSSVKLLRNQCIHQRGNWEYQDMADNSTILININIVLHSNKSVINQQTKPFHLLFNLVLIVNIEHISG